MSHRARAVAIMGEEVNLDKRPAVQREGEKGGKGAQLVRSRGASGLSEAPGKSSTHASREKPTTAWRH